MKLLLQQDWQADNMTFPAKQSIQQLLWKGEKCSSTFLTLKEILDAEKLDHYVTYTPIGTVEFVKAFAEKIGVKLPDPIHATELLKLEGREYWEDYSKELISKTLGMYPVFVKPYNELKKFTGFVAKSDKDFDLYPEIDWFTTTLFCTQVLENIVSEWRCHVLNEKVFACVNYAGDPLEFPWKQGINNMVQDLPNPPIAYSLDVAVCVEEGWTTNYRKTSIIEVNDAFSLGYYGGDVELYTKMLNERWKQIIKNQ